MRMGLVVVAAFLASPVLAADVQVYQLTPEQKAAAIASAAQQPERSALLPMADPDARSAGLPPSAEREAILGSSLYGAPPRDKKVHGEVGMFVGTGGARGIYGSAGVPLGENGMASFSFESSRLPGWNQWGRPGLGQRW